jgi:hypothetical protein
MEDCRCCDNLIVAQGSAGMCLFRLRKPSECVYVATSL